MPSVHFFQEDIFFQLPHPRKTAKWIKESAAAEGKQVGELNYVFCSDRFLSKLNLEFLSHKTLTDIITFDNSEEDESLHGDVYISIERVRENAIKFGESFDTELHRVIIHGLLHLAGYTDKSEPSKRTMRKKEDAYLSLRH